MSFLSVGATAEPGFLELIAVKRLETLLRDSFSYVLSAVAARSSRGGLRLLQLDEELYLLASLLVQATSLASNNASLAESLYGLRRVPVGAKAGASLNFKHRLLSLAMLVCAPYVSHRLTARASMPGLRISANDTHDAERGTRGGVQGSGDRSEGRSSAHLSVSHAQRARALICSVARQARAHAGLAVGLLSLAYQLLYLLRATPFFSPGLQFARVTLVRDDGSTLDRHSRVQAARLERQKAAQDRLRRAAAARRSPPLAIAYVALRVLHAVGNHTKTAVLSSLLFFKVLEWWFTIGEQELDDMTTTVPPPPPQYPRHTLGLPLPDHPDVCPICGNSRTAPAVLSVSGFVFCYKCIFVHVEQQGYCPVTLINAEVNDVRRLFASA